MPDTYQGFTNWESWVLCLWIRTVPAQVKHWNKVAEELENLTELADAMKRYFFQQAKLTTKTDNIFSVLLNASLDEINWFEVAKHQYDT